MKHYKTALVNEHSSLMMGEKLAHCLQKGLVIYLHGDLGAGKTTLTRSIIHALGYQGRVKSPTYTLVEPYIFSHHHTTYHILHFDLYRMNDAREFIDAGFKDEINQDTICIIEWPEKAQAVLPQADWDIDLTIEGEGRLIEIRSHTELGAQCLAKIKN